jgi:hypothetical protein
MRRLKPPTLQQWGCPQHGSGQWATGWWQVTHTIAQVTPFHRVRYMRCRRCGLRVKTEERLSVPWDERDLVEHVKQLLPEGRAVAIRQQGITTLPLAGLNRILEKHRLMIHASKGSDPTQMVTCVNDYGKVEEYGLFELQRLTRGRTGKGSR